MNDDIQFQNMDSYRGSSSGKFGLTFKQIVLMHINRCVQNGSVEWHGGFWIETGSNPVHRNYIPNTRDTYCNSIKMLRAILLGYFDKEIKEADKKLQEEYEDLTKKYSELIKKDNKSRSDWYGIKIDWHIKLFEQLIMLSKRLNFFEEETSEEEI